MLEAGKIIALHTSVGLALLLLPTCLNMLALPNAFVFYLIASAMVLILVFVFHKQKEREKNVGAAIVTLGSLYTTLGLGSLTVFQSSLVPVLSVYMFLMFLASRSQKRAVRALLTTLVLLVPIVLGLGLYVNKLGTMVWQQFMLDRANMLFISMTMLCVPAFLNHVFA